MAQFISKTYCSEEFVGFFTFQHTQNYTIYYISWYEWHASLQANLTCNIISRVPNNKLPPKFAKCVCQIYVSTFNKLTKERCSQQNLKKKVVNFSNTYTLFFYYDNYSNFVRFETSWDLSVIATVRSSVVMIPSSSALKFLHSRWRDLLGILYHEYRANKWSKMLYHLYCCLNSFICNGP